MIKTFFRIASASLPIFFFLYNQATAREPLHFASGAQQTVLLELFTSQGCSSCPPADDWLNKKTADPGLWHTFVPVAFHVDYWDRLGWKDPFGSAANSTRQFTYNQASRSISVYTPSFFVNGQEWKGWYRNEHIKQNTTEPGKLSATINDDNLSVEFPGNGADLELHVILLGMEITTDVKAGENKDRKLINSFVAMEHDIYQGSGNKWQVPCQKRPAIKPIKKQLRYGSLEAALFPPCRRQVAGLKNKAVSDKYMVIKVYNKKFGGLKNDRK